jgi:hypothetical protein
MPFSFIRRDYGNRIEYEFGTLVPFEIQNIQVEGNFAKNEEEFWKQDYSKINLSHGIDPKYDSNLYSTISLTEYLDSIKISKELFDKFRTFLTKNKLTGLQKGIPDENLIIYFEGLKGLVYSIDEYKKPRFPESHEINKIEGHWYYYGN